MISRICIIAIVLWSGQAIAQPADPVLVARVLAEGRVKDQAYAESVVLAAQSTSTPDFPVELLLGLADVESDFVPSSVSRLIGATWDPAANRWVGGQRVAGIWNSTKKPAGAHGNFFCGITQTTSPTWKDCLAARDPVLAMQTSVASLNAWMRRGKTVQRTLQGYGCGNAGMTGSCKAYAEKVLRRSRLFLVPRPSTPVLAKPSS